MSISAGSRHRCARNGCVASGDARNPRGCAAQPPARLSGFVPAGLVDAGATPGPAQHPNLGSETRAVDDWLLPARGATRSTVESVFVVAGGTGEPLVELDPSSRVTIDPAALGMGEFTLQAHLDSAQGAVAFELRLPGRKLRSKLARYSEVPFAPYTMFKREKDPFDGRRLRPGDYTVRVTPDGGVTRSYDFRVIGGVPRKLASYRERFRSDSPATRWFYLSNAAGPVDAPTRRLALNWIASNGAYAETGGSATAALHATGGRTGRGTAFVNAGYRVAANGFASVEALDVAPLAAESDGVRVLVLRETAGALTVVEDVGLATPADPIANHMTARFPVTAGDIVWVAIGPEGSRAADAFELDFDLWFTE